MIAVLSGPPGSGKSTLAHAFAARVGFPVIIRDEIKQGMVAATTPTRDGDYEDLNIPVLHAFFDVLTVLARSGISTVAEAAYQDKLWFYSRLSVVVSATCTALIHPRYGYRGPVMASEPRSGIPSGHRKS